MSREAISKRQLLRQAGAATALAVLPLACPARAQAKRQVTMRLDGLYQGPNAGFMIAQDKGFYDEVGLSVEVGPGNVLSGLVKRIDRSVKAVSVNSLAALDELHDVLAAES